MGADSSRLIHNIDNITTTFKKTVANGKLIVTNTKTDNQADAKIVQKHVNRTTIAETSSNMNADTNKEAAAPVDTSTPGIGTESEKRDASDSKHGNESTDDDV